MLSSLILLLGLAAQTAAPPDGPPPLPSADPPPTTIQDAIDRCELLEYPKPEEALKVVDYGLALEETPSPAQRGLLLACRAQLHFREGDSITALEVMDAALQLTEAEQLDEALRNGQFRLLVVHGPARGQLEPDSL
jgi:hypothetical protein